LKVLILIELNIINLKSENLDVSPKLNLKWDGRRLNKVKTFQ